MMREVTLRVLGQDARATLTKKLQALVDAWAVEWLGDRPAAVALTDARGGALVRRAARKDQEAAAAAWLLDAPVDALFGVTGFDREDSRVRAVIVAALDDLVRRVLGGGTPEVADDAVASVGASGPSNGEARLMVSIDSRPAIFLTVNDRLRDRVAPLAAGSRASLASRGEAALGVITQALAVLPMGHLAIGSVSSLREGDVLVSPRALEDGIDLRLEGGALGLRARLGATAGRHAVQPIDPRDL